MVTDSSKSGVRGWLAVLVVVIGLLFPLGQIGSFITLWKASPILEPRFGSNWPIYFGLTSSVIVLRTVICLFVANLLLNKKRSSTPKIAAIGIWVALIFLGVVSVVIASVFIPGSASCSGAIASLFWLLLMCIISTAYLLRSKRVALTYSAP